MNTYEINYFDGDDEDTFTIQFAASGFIDAIDRFTEIHGDGYEIFNIICLRHARA